MTRRPRLLFDVTFTRTQTVNVGITRTVRRLWPELESQSPGHGLEFMPVVFHSHGFRRYSAPGEPGLGVADTRLARLKTAVRIWLTEGPVRRLVSAHFALPLRRIAWAMFSWWEFNRLAAAAEPVDIAPSDVLLLCDASWSYRVWIAARMARRRGAKVVTMVYDLIPLRQPEYCTPLTAIALDNWLKRQLPISDLVLCISSAVEADLTRYATESSLPLGPTATLKLGCDPVVARHGGTVREEVARFISAAPCFTCVGSLEPRKNHRLLLAAFERLWDAGSDAHLLIMGRAADEYREIVERIAEVGARQPRLMAVFDASDDEVAHAYTNSRALVFPSLAEGFGLPLVEARTRGCLVIASDLPAFAELKDDGVTTFDRHSVDSLVHALAAHLAVDMRSHVKAMEPFTWSDSARACLRAFEGRGLVSRRAA